ncbi:MAG: endonuclease/exonuclease/phosphatase family protein [Spirochaetaceae bacterium]|jgi:exonuclease III|nr:endonuclease/exonuclease/phosphatase family protein [Spirochaetaceae bacterium]
MRIVSWNCRYGFKPEKAQSIAEYKPDILVIQEITKTEHDVLKSAWKYKNWYGDDVDEKSDIGISVFSNKYKIDFTPEFNRDFRYVVPYHVTGEGKDFILFAVWTKNSSHSYDENVKKAFAFYKNLIQNNAVFIGDFNTFSHNDNDLEKLEAALKPLCNCAKESENKTVTYFHNGTNSGTNDFCFATENMVKSAKMTILSDGWEKTENSQRWHGLSDHCPIIVDFDF